MARTLQDKFLLALLSIGEREVKRLTGCIVVSRQAGGYYYIGKRGSLRFGPTKAGSIPVHTRFENELLDLETKIK